MGENDMKNLREYKLLQEMKRLVNNMEKALNELISESRAYDAKKNKAA
jgi:hypothetical protein